MDARTRPFKASPVPDQKATNATEAQRLGGNSRRQEKTGDQAANAPATMA